MRYVPLLLSAGIALFSIPAAAAVSGDASRGAIVLAYNTCPLLEGYPDCRPEFIAAFAGLATLATKAGVEGQPYRIQAPLISLSKADIIREGLRLGVDYALTVSCYQADGDGRACGKCDSCRLRRDGFAAAGVSDPTRYRPL